MNSKKLVAVLLCLLLASFMFAACSSGGDKTQSEGSATEETGGATAEDAEAADAEASDDVIAETADAGTFPVLDKKDGERKIGATVIQGVSPHVQAWIQGVRDVVEGVHGDEFTVLDPDFDTQKQTTNVDDLVAAGCDGIIIEVIDGEALVSSVKKAVEKGIYVTSSDLPFSETNRDLIISEVMSDNYEGGQVIAQKMCDDLGGKGKIILMKYPGKGSADREDGMKSVIEQYPDIEIVAEGDGNGVIEKANSVMQNLMQAHPDLNAVIATNDHGAIGCMTALESAGRLKGVGIYGFDAVPEAVEFIEQGKFTASVRQNPYQLGKMSAEDLYKAMAGEEVGQKVKRVGIDLVTIDNAKDFEEYAMQ
jgi:ABC-type sugar transport system substrate-binding protein